MTVDQGLGQGGRPFPQPVLPLLMVAAAAAISAGFACVTPFPAFALAAAYLLRPRTALLTVTAVWLTNQAVGFAFLNYPLDGDTVLWGLAIGLATLAATAAARGTLRLVHWNLVGSLAAAGIFAFGLYEAGLLLVALVLGGTGAFTASIVGQFALLNIAWAAALLGTAEALRYAGLLQLDRANPSAA